MFSFASHRSRNVVNEYIFIGVITADSNEFNSYMKELAISTNLPEKESRWSKRVFQERYVFIPLIQLHHGCGYRFNIIIHTDNAKRYNKNYDMLLTHIYPLQAHCGLFVKEKDFTETFISIATNGSK